MWKKLYEAVLKLIGLYREARPDPKPTEDPGTDSGEIPANDPEGKIIWHTTSANMDNIPVVSRLEIKRISKSLFQYRIIGGDWPSVNGTVGNLVFALFRNGSWHAGPCDAMKPASTKPNNKEWGSLCVPEGDTRLFEPEKGEKGKVSIYGFCRNKGSVSPRQRTDWVDVVVIE